MPRGRDDRRREVLLDELESIVLAEGFSGLRIGPVASRLHCSRSTLYNLAPSKDELIVLLVRRFLERATADCAARADRFEDPMERLLTFISAIMEWQLRGSERFWHDVNATPALHAMIVARNGPANDYVRLCLEQGVASGHYRQLNARLMVRMVWALAGVTQDTHLLDELGISMDEAVGEFTRFVNRGLSADPR